MSCGISSEHQEEGLCPRHLAERWDITVGQVWGKLRVKTPGLEAGRAEGSEMNLACGTRRRGHQIVPLGMIFGEEQ